MMPRSSVCKCVCLCVCIYVCVYVCVCVNGYTCELAGAYVKLTETVLNPIR